MRVNIAGAGIFQKYQGINTLGINKLKYMQTTEEIKLEIIKLVISNSDVLMASGIVSEAEIIYQWVIKEEIKNP